MLPQTKTVPGCMFMLKMCLVVTCWPRKKVLPGHKMSCSVLLLLWPWLCGQNPLRRWCWEEDIRHQGRKLGLKASWISSLPPTSSPTRGCSRLRDQAGCQGCAGVEEGNWGMERRSQTQRQSALPKFLSSDEHLDSTWGKTAEKNDLFESVVAGWKGSTQFSSLLVLLTSVLTSSRPEKLWMIWKLESFCVMLHIWGPKQRHSDFQRWHL